jgi:hypothetical protein
VAVANYEIAILGWLSCREKVHLRTTRVFMVARLFKVGFSLLKNGGAKLPQKRVVANKF